MRSTLRLSRRNVVNRPKHILVFFAVIVGLVASACTSEESTESTAPGDGVTTSVSPGTDSTVDPGPGDEDWAEAPVTFVFVQTQEPATMDPTITSQFDTFSVTRNLYDPLVDLDETTTELVPALATSWETSPDGITHTFELREGVTFHDGSSLDAETVVLSLERDMGINQGVAFMLANFESIDAIDDMTVQITTATPDFFVPERLTKFGIVSSEALLANRTDDDPYATEFFSNNEAGSGPYVLESWETGVQVTLTKNEDWWNGPWPAGSIDVAIIKSVAESSARAELVAQGEADLATLWSIQDAVRVGSQPGFELQANATFDTNPIINLNVDNPPLDNLLFRQAIQAAFDYQAMVDFFQGYAVATTGQIPPDYPGGVDLPPFEQDLDLALELLDESGVNPDDVNLTFMAPAGFADLEASAIVMQDSLADIGVNVTIETLPFGSIVDAFGNPDTAGDITALYNSPFSLDPTQFMQNLLPGTFANFAHYDNPEVVEMIGEITGSQDEARVAELMEEIQVQIREDAAFIWGSRPQTLVVVPEHVRGYVMQKFDFRFPIRLAPIRLVERG